MGKEKNDGFNYNVGEKVTCSEKNRMLRDIVCIVNSISDDRLKETVLDVLNKSYKEAFSESPAAVSVHHEYNGGLLKHTYGMVKMAASICKCRGELNRDIVIAGCALHDIGKIEELGSEDGKAHITNRGRMLGHLELGVQMFSKLASEHGLCEKTTLEIEHIIASHHGELEWGAIVKPVMAEAYIVHAIDMIDSRLEMFNNEAEYLEPGQFSENRSKYLGNIHVYKA